MSHLDNGFRSLTLQRFPATDDVNPLQAWEAADEYLLQQLDDTEIRGPVLILNDALKHPYRRTQTHMQRGGRRANQ